MPEDGGSLDSARTGTSSEDFRPCEFGENYVLGIVRGAFDEECVTPLEIEKVDAPKQSDHGPGHRIGSEGNGGSVDSGGGQGGSKEGEDELTGLGPLPALDQQASLSAEPLRGYPTRPGADEMK